MSYDSAPEPDSDDTSFAAELGRAVGGLGFLAVFFAIVGVIAWLVLKG